MPRDQLPAGRTVATFRLPLVARACLRRRQVCMSVRGGVGGGGAKEGQRNRTACVGCLHKTSIKLLHFCYSAFHRAHAAVPFFPLFRMVRWGDGGMVGRGRDGGMGEEGRKERRMGEEKDGGDMRWERNRIERCCYAYISKCLELVSGVGLGARGGC